MPELPEVETIRRGLENLIVGRKILDVAISNPKSFSVSVDEIKDLLIGSEIIAVHRRAKVLIINLANDYSMVIHLKMTGQIVFRGEESWGGGHPNDSFINDLPDRSTRVEFALSSHRTSLLLRAERSNPALDRHDDKSSRDDNDATVHLFFNDQRKFGWIKLVPTASVYDMEFIAKLGPEPLIGKPEKEFLRRVRKRNNSIIKAAILDQAVVAGIGNIYADESLWMAKVHPMVRVRDLSDNDLKRVLRSAIHVMNRALDAGGSTMNTYVNADGKKGNYLSLFANVFRRDGEPCLRCNAIIEKIRVAGRGTHICPKCQKLR